MHRIILGCVSAALFAATSAHAVFVNPDGAGQGLIYPYYTTQAIAGNAYNSLLSVVNTTNSAVQILHKPTGMIVNST